MCFRCNLNEVSVQSVQQLAAGMLDHFIDAADCAGLDTTLAATIMVAELLAALNAHSRVDPQDVVSLFRDLVLQRSIEMQAANGGTAPPVGSPDLAYHLQWLHFAEGAAMTRITTEFLLKAVKGAPPGVRNNASTVQYSRARSGSACQRRPPPLACYESSTRRATSAWSPRA